MDNSRLEKIYIDVQLATFRVACATLRIHQANAIHVGKNVVLGDYTNHISKMRCIWEGL